MVLTSVTATLYTSALISVLIGLVTNSFMESGWGHYPTLGDKITQYSIWMARITLTGSVISFVWSNLT